MSILVYNPPILEYSTNTNRKIHLLLFQRSMILKFKQWLSTESHLSETQWELIIIDKFNKKVIMMMMEDTRRQVAMGDMVHDMLIDRPPSPARMEYRQVYIQHGWICIYWTYFRSDNLARSMQMELNMIRKHHELCDVIIIVGGKEIHAHKNILAACSPYFR